MPRDRRHSRSTHIGAPMHPFEAMAEPARRRIIDILASGEHTSGQLAEVLGKEYRISRTAVSKHLRILRDTGFVDVRAEERWRWYRLLDRGVASLEAVVLDLRAKSDGAIDPLRPFARPVPRKGPGRDHHRGTRGRQSDIMPGSDPWDAPL